MTGYDIVREDFPDLTDAEILVKMQHDGDCPTLYGLDEKSCNIIITNMTGMCDDCWTDALRKEYPE